MIIAYLTDGEFLYPILILLAGGGIALLALQSLISSSVNQTHLGKIQGILVSITNTTEIFDPSLFAFIYSKTQPHWTVMSG